ncbi:MAG TPA: ABC transporter permease [Chloroflexota bacterium]|nr:ABC transporter permease [Chloroflexota bacterium]
MGRGLAQPVDRSAGLGPYVVGRLMQAVPLLLGVIVVNFLLIQLAPGDPTTVLVGDYPAPAEYVAQVRHDFGLDEPVPVRLASYLGQLAHGNLGYSFANRQSVAGLIGERLGSTLELTLTALVAATIAGILLGVLAAVKRGGAADGGAQVVSLAGFSVPEFWLGQILIVVFAVVLGWLPSQGNRSVRSTAQGLDAVLEALRYLLLPALALSFRYLALISRLTRASMLEVLNADYILAARARGAPERTVLFAHALRNAAAPIITVVGYNLGFIFAGSALIETVFGWPGIGRLLFDSVSKRDYPVLLGVLLLVSATVVLVNLITDVVHALIDPRVRYR